MKVRRFRRVLLLLLVATLVLICIIFLVLRLGLICGVFIMLNLQRDIEYDIFDLRWQAELSLSVLAVLIGRKNALGILLAEAFTGYQSLDLVQFVGASLVFANYRSLSLTNIVVCKKFVLVIGSLRHQEVIELGFVFLLEVKGARFLALLNFFHALLQ